MQTTCSLLKQELESVKTFGEAELMVSRAIEKADRRELLRFLQDLYGEFIGPDGAGGGCSGTLQHIKTLTASVSPTDSEISSWGVSPEDFWAILRHT